MILTITKTLFLPPCSSKYLCKAPNIWGTVLCSLHFFLLTPPTNFICLDLFPNFFSLYLVFLPRVGSNDAVKLFAGFASYCHLVLTNLFSTYLCRLKHWITRCAAFLECSPQPYEVLSISLCCLVHTRIQVLHLWICEDTDDQSNPSSIYHDSCSRKSRAPKIPHDYEFSSTLL